MEHQFNDLQQTIGNIPVVFCGNKVDIRGAAKDDTYYIPPTLSPTFSTNRMYFFLSAKSNYNFEKPFLFLARKVLNQPNLQFV